MKIASSGSADFLTVTFFLFFLSLGLMLIFTLENKEISKFYVEGLDTLQGKYAMITEKQTQERK